MKYGETWEGDDLLVAQDTGDPCPWGCERTWEEPHKYLDDGTGICKGKCQNCGHERTDFLLVKFHPTPILIEDLWVMAITYRYDLSRCCLCGKIVETPLIMFPMDAQKHPYAFDFCDPCFAILKPSKSSLLE